MGLEAMKGHDDDGASTSFGHVDGLSKNKTLKPTSIRTPKAVKALSATSAYPTLGIDTTLPQFRADPSKPDQTTLRPQQDEYPVWYFLYGTLADPTVLSRVIGHVPQSILEYRPARVYGGRLGTWAGTYKALKNGAASAVVVGWAYRVADQDEEEALQCFETGQYEVVRCEMELLGGRESTRNVVKGLTFRFVG